MWQLPSPSHINYLTKQLKTTFSSLFLFVLSMLLFPSNFHLNNKAVEPYRVIIHLINSRHLITNPFYLFYTVFFRIGTIKLIKSLLRCNYILIPIIVTSSTCSKVPCQSVNRLFSTSDCSCMGLLELATNISSSCLYLNFFPFGPPN